MKKSGRSKTSSMADMNPAVDWEESCSLGTSGGRFFARFLPAFQKAIHPLRRRNHEKYAAIGWSRFLLVGFVVVSGFHTDGPSRSSNCPETHRL
jgi:hypothetical protein